MEQSDLVREKLTLGQEMRDYIKENGFNFTEYCAPTAGGWYENYRRREREILDRLLVKR